MVNTFLVCEDFAESAKILDKRRLGKQRVEARQIIDALEGKTKGWNNHPVTRSWKDHIDALKLYFNSIVSEWCSRGGVNNYELFKDIPEDSPRPHWCSSEKVHYSHYAQLLQKDPEEYSFDNIRSRISSDLVDYLNKMPSEYNNLGYIWPYKYTKEELSTLEPCKLCEPYIERKICNGVYKNGKKCRNKASSNDKCKLHCENRNISPVKCEALTKSGAHCRNKSKYPSKFCGVHSR